MKKKQKKIYLQLKKRYLKKIFGTEYQPRLSVFRSNNHIYAQIINDFKGETFCSMSSLDKTFKFNSEKNSKKTKTIAFEVGQKLGILAIQKNIKKVSFDLGSKLYHGRIKSLAEGARVAGLVF